VRQTLRYLPVDFGILLAIWAVVSVAVLAYQIYRHGLGKESLSFIPVLLMLGAVVKFVLPAIAEPRGLPVRGYGVMLLSAVLAAFGLALYRARRRGVPAEVIHNLAFWLVIGGIGGARLFYVVEYHEYYLQGSLGETLARIVNISQGGLVVYGSVFGGAAALWLFSRKHHLPGLALADLIAPSVLLGVALGRIGCFLNGCCYGGECELRWAVQFPWGSPPHVDQAEHGKIFLHGIKVEPDGGEPTIVAVEPESEAAAHGLKAGMRIASIDGIGVTNAEEARAELLKIDHAGQPISIVTADSARPKEWTEQTEPPRSLPVHPAQLYSAFDAALICLFLLAYDPFRRSDGELLAWSATIYPITRFLIEIIRTDESAVFGTGLSISQNISLMLVVGAGLFWVYLRRRSGEIAWPVVPAAAGVLRPV
jgi:phosphatidylglycerol:prolipoprotein diacylglycerol transferase